MHYKQTKLSDVWRTCNKIRAAIFRIGLNLWDYFLPLDPNKNRLISESQFISVLYGQLRGKIGLSEQEISDLADYFRVQDGRVFYAQLCEVIHNSVPDFMKNQPLVSGIEWEDPMQVNRLSMSEERKLNLLLTKIATVVNMRRLVMRPYFQDYELIAKNHGVVTIAHFARILDFLKIMVSPVDFNLLVKKFLKDSYTVNYIAFLGELDKIVQYLNQHGVLDLGGDMVSQFPGRVIDAELPKLPRPEIGKILASSLFGKKNVFHPALKEKYQNEDLITIMSRIQQHVLKNRLRVNEFFKDFDPLRCGKITTSQFHRGLDSLGISGIQRMFLSLPEIETLITQYRDPTDPMRVCWQTFEDDVDHVFTTKNLEKTPELEVNPPSQEVQLLQRKGTKAWHQVNTSRRNLCEDAVDKIKKRVLKRGLLLKPSFRDYDKTNNGHVTIPNARQCLVSNGILLSDEELYALEERYNSDMGFNYFHFLKEVEPKREEVPLYQGLYAKTKAVNQPPPKKPPTREEKDIVQILAKIKAKVVRDRIRVVEFLKDYDRCNEQVIKREDFKRGLSDCRFGLTENEMQTLMEIFASPLRRECIDYRKFSEVIEESFTQSCLERAPLIVPLQHVPTKDCEKNFLNFEERREVSIALQKLAKKPDLQMNILCVFQDYDKANCGTVTREQFLKALHMRGMADLVSTNEFEVICKCFGFERGMRDEVDYRSFIKALDVLYATDKYTPI
ncbi:uncharacterized protein LOC123671052 [Harmonia axyridis]|uniref:uncharacterized protein LOC123671052 n=1 Tax=Harmonia axyridis TaxID=115357 RepID=UPI001E275CBF|nr:uncharacterized protein LOC123671052 [Harmonia axyridis]